MELKVLGSSSNGNCYILKSSEGEILLLECGVKYKDILKGIDCNVSKVAGCLVSHEHKDHSSAVHKILDNGIPVYASNGTLKSCKVADNHNANILTHNTMCNIGSFRVLPFLVKHDCSQPFGFLIRHRECGVVLFATDTYYLPNKFNGLNNILIECNYSKEKLFENYNAGIIHDKLLARTLQSHMSLDSCLEALKANDLRYVNNIVLIHLSDRGSDEKMFQQAIADETCKTVYVADKGLSIPFNTIPF